MKTLNAFARRRRRWLTYWLPGGIYIALTANLGFTQSSEYVITFDNVDIRGVDMIDTPEVAHREVPGLDNSPVPSEPRTEGASKKADLPKRADASPPQLPEISIRIGQSLPFEPRDGTANPSFVQEAFLVEAFWGAKIGTREGYFKRAHFHPPDLSTGFEAQHLGNPNELHGLYIRSLDGRGFGVKSLRYRVTRNRQMPTKSLSIEGFSNFNVNVLLARWFNPRSPVRVQFTPFPVGLAVGNDMNLPWATLRIFGFELVEQLYIASSASVDLDNIVLTRREPPASIQTPPSTDK